MAAKKERTLSNKLRNNHNSVWHKICIVPFKKAGDIIRNIGEEQLVESSIYTLLSQQQALQRQMQVIANNVANMNTTGYKNRGVLFQDFIEQPNPKFTHHMVVDRGTMRDTSQGTLIKTDNPLDLAISGNGYFAVQTPEGIQYTRQGSFQLDSEGSLVTPDGYKVLSGGGTAVSIPDDAKEISVGRDGTISTDKGTLTRLELVHFDNELEMEETHSGLYQSAQAPTTDNDSTLYQGMVEGSNVKPVAEITQITEITRAYQYVVKLVDSENQRISNVVRTLGRAV